MIDEVLLLDFKCEMHMRNYDFTSFNGKQIDVESYYYSPIKRSQKCDTEESSLFNFDKKNVRASHFLLLLMIVLFQLSLYSQAIGGNMSFLHSKKISDTINENKIILVPVKNSTVYTFGKVIYSGSLDTLIKEITISHEVGMSRRSQKINGQSFYWKMITRPYWCYGGHCLLINAKKLKNSKWEIELLMNFARKKPKYPWRIHLQFRLDYYQEIIDRAIKKSPN